MLIKSHRLIQPKLLWDLASTGEVSRSQTLPARLPAVVSAPAETPGECTASAGTLSFAEIQRIVADDATVTLDKDAGVQIVVFDNDQWVSYDDSETFKIKLDYANGLCLGGTMVWVSSLCAHE
jgi:hypothetical protein